MPALARLEIEDPEACVSLHVDDIGITVIDTTRLKALRRFENILNVARGEFTKLNLPLAREKGVVIATSKELAEKANKMVGDIAATTGTHARRLGVDYCTGKTKPALKVHKTRVAQANK